MPHMRSKQIQTRRIVKGGGEGTKALPFGATIEEDVLDTEAGVVNDVARREQFQRW
jgi:hypothetical protein